MISITLDKVSQSCYTIISYVDNGGYQNVTY